MHRLVLTQGERNGDASVIVALVSRQIIPSIDDFYRIPGDSDHMIFYIFALLSWSYLSVSLYYAYCAPERAQEKHRDRRYTIGTLERNPQSWWRSRRNTFGRSYRRSRWPSVAAMVEEGRCPAAARRRISSIARRWRASETQSVC